jgi:hypothetical protein
LLLASFMVCRAPTRRVRQVVRCAAATEQCECRCQLCR